MMIMNDLEFVELLPPTPPLNLTDLDPVAMRPNLGDYNPDELLDARTFIERYGVTAPSKSLGQHVRAILDEHGIESTAGGTAHRRAVYPAKLWLAALARRGGPYPSILVTVLEVSTEE